MGSGSRAPGPGRGRDVEDLLGGLGGAAAGRNGLGRVLPGWSGVLRAGCGDLPGLQDALGRPENGVERARAAGGQLVKFCVPYNIMMGVGFSFRRPWLG